MHSQWEELLPFYVAGSLPKPEAARLEHHLSHCTECSRSLNDWRLVAGAVRAEAASQLRDLPPLSPEVLRIAAERMRNPQWSVNTASYAPLPMRRQAPSRRFGSTPITLAAAAFTVLLLVLMALRLTPTPQGTNGVVLMPSATPSETATGAAPTQTLPLIIVIEPSNTPTPREDEPTRVPPTSIPPPTVIVPTQIPPTFVMPTQIPASPEAATPMPIETTPDGAMALAQMASVGGGGCTLQAAIPSGSVINLYAQPRIDSTVLTTISSAELLTGLAMSDNSWFQLQSERGYVGWVQQGLVAASGSCDGLPLVFTQNSTVVVTPTETVLPFPTLEPNTATNDSAAFGN